MISIETSKSAILILLTFKFINPNIQFSRVFQQFKICITLFRQMSFNLAPFDAQRTYAEINFVIFHTFN